jgi:hypothetical protein
MNNGLRIFFVIQFFLTILFLLVGCAPKKFEPEIPQPSDARIQELLAMPVPHKFDPKPIKFHAEAYPKIIIEGAAVVAKCFVPESFGAGKIAFGIPGVEMRGPMEIEHIEHSFMIQHVPCGQQKVVCAIQDYTGKKLYNEASLIVRGGMCDDGSDK